MAEMLVNSTKLDACLDAEADAIRAKTGGSTDLTFDFANNKGFADAIAAIPSGGGVESVEGTFTLANDGEFPTITHSLGTTKIAGFVVPHYTIVAHGGYRHYFSFFLNWTAFIDDEQTWGLDFTPYNSTRFPDVVTVENSIIKSLKKDTGYASPWTSQSDPYIGTYYGGMKLTENTVRVGTGEKWASGTYYYKIFKLE